MKAALLAGVFMVLGISAAFGQAALFSPDAMVRQTIVPPVLKEIASKPASLPMPETIVISHGRGGVVAEHELKFFTYWHSGNKVEIRGPCYSACTLVTAFIGKDKLCIAEGAFLAFHAVRSLEKQELLPAATERLYWLQPIDIRRWIDRAGGYASLPLNGFWTMYDRELWAMGYPKCQ